MILGPNGAPLPPTEEEQKAHIDRINTILAGINALYNEQKVTFDEGMEVIANLVVGLMMRTKPGAEGKWLEFFLNGIMATVNAAMPKKRDQDAAQAGINRLMDEQLKGPPN